MATESDEIANDADVESVSEGKPFLRAMLNRNRGGAAVVIVGDEWRMLWYHPRSHGPFNKLPWPLSWIQPRGCALWISVVERTSTGVLTGAGKLLRTVEFSRRSKHEAAISQFLQNASPDDMILFTLPSE